MPGRQRKGLQKESEEQECCPFIFKASKFNFAQSSFFLSPTWSETKWRIAGHGGESKEQVISWVVFPCVRQTQKKALCPWEEDGVFSLCCCCYLVAAKSCPPLLWPQGLQPARPLCPCCVDHSCPAHHPHPPPLLRFLLNWCSDPTHDAELRRRRKWTALGASGSESSLAASIM